MVNDTRYKRECDNNIVSTVTEETVMTYTGSKPMEIEEPNGWLLETVGMKSTI